MNHTWTCRCCGQQFNELPLAMVFDAPAQWHALTETERESRGRIDINLCSIDDHYFVRGCLDVPIVDRHPEYFSWGVWVSVSAKSFKHVLDMWDTEIPDDEPPLFGWLCNSINIYPETHELKTHVYLRSGGIRPYIELEPTDHPLAIEQREGITMQRVEEIVAACRTH